MRLSSCVPAKGQVYAYNSVTGLWECANKLTVASGLSMGRAVTGQSRTPVSLRDFVSVKDYGAMCDGVTDDATAFINALASGAMKVYANIGTCHETALLTMAAGQHLIFGPGIHTIGGIRLPDSTTVAGVGYTVIQGSGSGNTTLKLVSGANRDIIASKSVYTLMDTGSQFGTQNIQILGLTLDGNKVGQVVSTVTITKATTTNPIVYTTSRPHGFANGDIVSIKNVGGNFPANGVFKIKDLTVTTFSVAKAGSGTYTSGGNATNAHVNGIALYGRGPHLSDVVVQNCAGNGYISGWAVEPSTGYLVKEDRVNGLIGNFRSTLNEYHGLVWHGPHDSTWQNIDVYSNKGIGFITLTQAGVFTAAGHVIYLNTYGNNGGGVLAGDSLEGTDLVGSSAFNYGAFFETSAGGNNLTGSSFGGATPLIIASGNNSFKAIIANSDAGKPGVEIRTTYGNNNLDFDMFGLAGYAYKITSQNGTINYRGGIDPSASFDAMFDPAGAMPSPYDTIEVSSNLVTTKIPNRQRSSGLSPWVYTDLTTKFSAAINGVSVFCADCQPAATCVASGKGALAVKLNGLWSCSGPGVYNPAVPIVTVPGGHYLNVPTGIRLFHLNAPGFAAIIPIPGDGCIDIIPDQAYVTVTGDNVAIGSTAVIGKLMRYCYDATTTKWYPSY